MDRIILHSDLNNFFASVEAAKNPLLRGKAFAVAGNPEKRHGIILAKSQLAKAYGVSTGEAIWQAKLKCPDLLLVKPDMLSYHRYSEYVTEIYRRFTDEIEPFGIDEAWLDVTGSTRLFGDGKEIADQIRKTIREELGLTVSIGVSYNKIFAKLGSDLKKPDATTVISRKNFKKIVHPLPISTLLFVGRSTKEKLYRYGIRTIGHLAAVDPHLLNHLLGKNGSLLHHYANGSDIGAALLTQAPPPKSIGNSVTTAQDLTTNHEVWIQLLMLSEHVATRLREQNYAGNLIHLSIRDANLRTITRQKTLEVPTNHALKIATIAFSLFEQNYDLTIPIRSIGVSLGNLTNEDGNLQLSFSEPIYQHINEHHLDQAIDHLRNRYGFNCVVRAGCLHHQLKNYTLSNDPHAPSSLCTLPGCKH